MKLNKLMADEAVLQELGKRITARRIEMNLTQVELAARAGVSKRTVERLEGGESTQLANFIRILRSLGLMERLTALLPEDQPGPVALLKNRGRQRKRVYPRKTGEQKKPWSWGDDEE